MPACECLSSRSSLPAPTTNHAGACSIGGGWLDDLVYPSSWLRRLNGKRNCRLTCCGVRSCHVTSTAVATVSITHLHHTRPPDRVLLCYDAHTLAALIGARLWRIHQRGGTCPPRFQAEGASHTIVPPPLFWHTIAGFTSQSNCGHRFDIKFNPLKSQTTVLEGMPPLVSFWS